MTQVWQPGNQGCESTGLVGYPLKHAREHMLGWDAHDRTAGHVQVLYCCFTVALLDLLHDAWFYFTHRLLHWRPLYRHIHRLHHECAPLGPPTVSRGPLLMRI